MIRLFCLVWSKNITITAELSYNHIVFAILQPAVEDVSESSIDKTILFGVIAVAVVLAVLILVMCITAWTCRKK